MKGLERQCGKEDGSSRVCKGSKISTGEGTSHERRQVISVLSIRVRIVTT